MAIYDLTLLFSSNLNPSEREEREKKIAEIIKAGEGEMLEKTPYGRRKLAFPLKKEEYGEYALWTFQGNGKCLTPLEKYLKLADGILRYLFIRRQ